MSSEDSQGFTGQRVVVSGCSSGIGEQLVAIIRARGGEVIGLDRQPSSAIGLKFHQLDLADSDSISAAVAAIADPVDVLINVAGVSGTRGAEQVIGINFVGTRELTEALLPRMSTSASVVITASLAASRYQERRELIAGLLATADRGEATQWCRQHREQIGTGYAISKDALVWYTLTRATELAQRGIRINCLAPGTTDTPILDDVRRSRGASYLNAIPTPLGRIAAPREQAEILAFLASRSASYLAGQILWSDGGYTAGVLAEQTTNVTGDVGPARS